MTPAYPKLELSHVAGVKKASLEMFNRRQDVQFYEIGVFTEKWEPVPFVSAYMLIQLEYQKRVRFDVYIRDEDAKRATYVCTKSKLRIDQVKGAAVSSRICSRFAK